MIVQITKSIAKYKFALRAQLVRFTDMHAI